MILTGGQQLTIENHESILEACIRSGIRVNYGCADGNCGSCRAQLVSGQLKQLAHSDYVMSAADKSANSFLMCVNTAASDCTIEAKLGDADGIQDFRVRILELKSPDNNVYLLSVKPPRRHRLRFQAGQYARLALHQDTNSTRTSRFISIASCPCDGRRIEFHIANSHGHIFVQNLLEHIRDNKDLYLKAPYGEFVFSEQLDRNVVLFAVDAGFAPIKSLIEHISAQESETPIHLYWLAPKDRYYMYNLCRSWRDALDQMKIDMIDLPTRNPFCPNIEEERTPTIQPAIEEAFEKMLTTEREQFADSPTDVYCVLPQRMISGLHNRTSVMQLPNWRFFYEPIRAGSYYE